ncbi:MAG: hypothetical protein IJ415_03775, partial [Clostridia bacterium]|nr:hypothetical protein [Clostridia bacterium]
NTDGFKLVGTNTITPNTDNGGTKLSTMFLSSYFKDENTNDDVTMRSAVIGVGSPSTSWVSSKSGEVSIQSQPATSYATIKIPKSSTEYNEYKIRKVTYKGTPGVLYDVTAEFCYIDLNENSSLVVPDYNSVGIETTFFKITYNPDEVDNINLDLTNAVKVWTMNLDKLTSGPASSVTAKVDSIEGVTTPTVSDNGISISAETLDAYKKQYPNKKNYPSHYATITVNNTTTLYCEIVFALYDYVKVETSYTAGSTENITMSLLNNIYVPIKVDGSDVYLLLSNEIKKYKYNSTDKKIYAMAVDGTTETEIEGEWATANSNKFTDTNGVVYQIIYDEDNNITSITVDGVTYDISSTLSSDDISYFVTSNVNKVTSVVEKSYVGYLLDYSNGEITLDGEEINTYFTTNVSTSTLSFICSLTTSDGTLEFEITVNKN